jgi:hypothetical protein
VRGIGKRAIVVQILTPGLELDYEDAWNGSDEQIADVAAYASGKGWKHVTMYYSWDYACFLIARADQMQNNWGRDLGEGYYPDPSRGSEVIERTPAQLRREADMLYLDTFDSLNDISVIDVEQLNNR